LELHLKFSEIPKDRLESPKPLFPIPRRSLPRVK